MDPDEDDEMADLQSICEFAKLIARQAGELVMEAIALRKENVFNITVKSGVDLVTETDQKSEDFIISHIRERYPHHRFVAEESKHTHNEVDTSTPTWYIDPLDGTTNFIHLFPYFCVSIGLTIGGRPVVGVVYNPVSKELYSAYYEGGAYLNGKQLHVSSAREVGNAIVVNNIGKRRDETFVDLSLSRYRSLLLANVRALRSTGSAAMNMCLVASGVMDVYYEDGYGGPWDVAAGTVIVAEAGGVCWTLDRDPLTLSIGEGQVICGNEHIVCDVLDVIM